MNENDIVNRLLNHIVVSKSVFEAPSIYKEGDFEDYLSSRIDNYYNFLKEESFSTFLNELYKIRENIESSKDELKLLNRIGGFITVLKRGLNNYFNGKPNKFYESFASSMDKLLNFRSYIIISPIESHSDFYRIRKSDKPLEAAKDLFHIPFQLRHLCNTQRYSIPGVPSIYLGSSSRICFCELEVNDSNLTEHYASRFQLNKNINVIEILTLEDFQNKMERTTSFFDKIDLLLKFIMLFPLFLSCTIKVKASGSFKPEYIVPQFLLEFVSSRDDDSVKIHGIKFPSTKIDYINSIERDYNLVLPIVESRNHGYCATLKKLLMVSDPLPINDIFFINRPDSFTSTEKIDFQKLDEGITKLSTRIIE